MNRFTVSIIAATLLVAACSTVPLRAPQDMLLMEEQSDSQGLTEKFFPGHKGYFYADPGAGEETPIFGVVHDKNDPGKLFLAGASADRSWSESVPLEAAGRRVVSAKPLGLWLGDIRKDGTAEILLILETASEGEKGIVEQKRTAAYLFELSKRVGLLWYQTLAYEGEKETPCLQQKLRFTAQPDFELDEDGRLAAVKVDFAKSDKLCAGGSGCEKEKNECAKDSLAESIRLEWDEQLRTYKIAEAEEVILKIPDVTL